MKRLYVFDDELIPVLFPDYRIYTESTYLPYKSIYVGTEPSVDGDLTAYHRVKILTSKVDLSIPDAVTAVRFAHSRKNKRFSAGLERYVSKLSKDDFLRELYYFMALGKWDRITSVDSRVYDLFLAFTESRGDFMQTYFSIREGHSFQEVWSSVLTFFIRAVRFSPDDTSISKYYRGIILKFKDQVTDVSSVVRFITGNHYDELAFLNLIIGMR